MFLQGLIFLFYIYNSFLKKERDNSYLFNNNNDNEKKYKNKNKNKFSGNDETYKIVESDMKIYNFTKNLEKKFLLAILKNNNITLNNKVNLLRDNSIQSYNIKSGGLISDFD